MATKLRDVHVWLESDAFDRLAEKAKADERSVAQMGRVLILRGLRESPVELPSHSVPGDA
jgi:hypothetical protein